MKKNVVEEHNDGVEWVICCVENMQSYVRKKKTRIQKSMH